MHASWWIQTLCLQLSCCTACGAVTHGHIDHVGALSLLLEQYPHMKVVIHEEEGPYMQGQKLYFSVEGRSMQLKALHFLEAVPGKQFQVLKTVSMALHGWAVSGMQVHVQRGPSPHKAVAARRAVTHCLLIKVHLATLPAHPACPLCSTDLSSAAIWGTCQACMEAVEMSSELDGMSCA